MSPVDKILFVTTGVLVLIEAIRFGRWAVSRLGVWLDRRYEAKQLREQSAARFRRAERSRLNDVGNVAKLGLLRQAGLVGDSDDVEVVDLGRETG